MVKTIRTCWEVRTYDVWGNATDGYEVNDSFRQGNIELRCKVERFNIGTDREFESATPSDYQLRKIFGVKCAIETEGDDLTIFVERARDGYPIGQLHCLSHESLSPIRKVARRG